MKVLHVFRPSDGGMKNHLYTLTKTLPEYEITPVLCGPQSLDVGDDIDHVKLDISNDLLLSNDLKALYKLRQTIFSIQPDLVHAHGYKATLLTDGATRLTRFPWICTLHNFRTWKRDAHIINEAYKRLIKNTLSRAEAVLCVSKALRQELLTIGLPEDKSKVLYNGIFVERFHRSLDLAKKTENFYNKKLIICIARLAPDKGVENFLSACKFLVDKYASHLSSSNISFAVVGDGPYRDYYQQMAWDMKIASWVHFLGYRRDISELLKSSLILIIPSRYEGLSLTAIEGMAAMCPVIASNTGGLREVIIDGETGLLVSSDNYSEIARDVVFLLKSKTLRRKLIFKAYKNVLDNFTHETMLKNTVNLYREVQGIEN